MPKLKCINSGSFGDDVFEVGRIYEMDEEGAALLMRRSPSTFEVVEGVVRVGGPDQYIDYSEPAPAVETQAASASEAPAPAPPADPDPLPGGDFLPDDGDEESDVDVEDMTAGELRAYAADCGIDLGRASKLKTLRQKVRDFLSAHSTHTATGLVPGDRLQRGGRIR